MAIRAPPWPSMFVETATLHAACNHELLDFFISFTMLVIFDSINQLFATLPPTKHSIATVDAHPILRTERSGVCAC